MSNSAIQEAYEKWAFTPYDGPLWNFKEATWNAWQAAWKMRSQQTPEIATLKNLFRAYATDIEKVANEMVQPYASGQISVPPEVIDYWLQHLEMIVTVDSKSLLGKDTRNLTQHQKKNTLLINTTEATILKGRI